MFGKFTLLTSGKLLKFHWARFIIIGALFVGCDSKDNEYARSLASLKNSPNWRIGIGNIILKRIDGEHSVIFITKDRDDSVLFLSALRSSILDEKRSYVKHYKTVSKWDLKVENPSRGDAHWRIKVLKDREGIEFLSIMYDINTGSLVYCEMPSDQRWRKVLGATVENNGTGRGTGT